MRALYITDKDIMGNPTDGGIQCDQRNYFFMEEFIGKDNISVAAFNLRNMEPCSKYAFCSKWKATKQMLQLLFLRKQSLPSEERRVLGDIKREYDLVFVNTSFFYPIVKKSESKTIVFMHNVETDHVLDKIKRGMVWLLPMLLVSYVSDKISMKYADWVICLNQRDQSLIKRRFDRMAELILPISFRDVFDESQCVTNVRKELLFVGSYFASNYIGLKWFIKNVMSRLPDYKLIVVGKGFEKKKRELTRTNVEIVGTVDDVGTYYYSYPVVIMPITYGAGMKVKTAAAMMYGRIILGTDEALEGYDVEGIKGIYRCNRINEWVNTIEKLYTQGITEKYAIDVREQFLTKYEYSICAQKFNSFMQKNMGTDFI